jgi:hypothetical protein
MLLALCMGFTARAEPGVLRVCADPNNLPFSNGGEEGFENRIVRLIAAQLGAAVEYTWWAQRRGFIRNTLNAGRCDVVAGVPAADELTLTTRPYYRSRYVRGASGGEGNDAARSRRPGAAGAADRRADDRRRLRQPAARPCAQPPRAGRQRARLPGLRRLP